MNNSTRLLIASVISIATTSFGFVVRSFLITEWGTLFNLTETQKGALNGAGLFPFAVSTILVALVIDKLGYGRTMAMAWVGHIVAAVVTMTASSYSQLYLGTLIFALANGAVEAVTNPTIATLYPRDKVKYSNILHSGWPGGLLVGGLLFVAMGSTSWQLKIGLFLLPAVVYGVMMLVLRIFSAGPLVHRLTPVGLLFLCALLAAAGLALLSNAGAAAGMIFVAATLYGVGKTFFWPTTLGLVSEQVPKGGALTISAMGGMGMIAAGVLGLPFLGALQDQKLDQALMVSAPAIHSTVVEPPQSFPLIRGIDSSLTAIGPYRPIDRKKLAELPADPQASLNAVIADNPRWTLQNRQFVDSQNRQLPDAGQDW